MTVVVPTAEVLLGGGWLLGWRAWVPFGGLSPLLLGATMLYAAKWAISTPPDCGCFGRWVRFDRVERLAPWLIARNTVMLLALAIGFARSGHGTSRAAMRSRAEPISRGPTGVGASGFTLIETIISMGLVGLLVTLLLPALAGARRQAAIVDSLADLRSHAAVFAIYQADYGETLPFLTDPRATVTVFRHPTGAVMELEFFGVTNAWHWPLIAEGYYASDDPGQFTSPRDQDRLFSSYMLPATNYSSPDFWRLETRTGPEQWRPVRAADITWPSEKAVLFNRVSLSSAHWSLDGEPVHVSFTDGSARTVARRMIAPPYPKGEGSWPGSFYGNGLRLMHTIGGARATDVQ